MKVYLVRWAATNAHVFWPRGSRCFINFAEAKRFCETAMEAERHRDKALEPDLKVTVDRKPIPIPSEEFQLGRIAYTLGLRRHHLTKKSYPDDDTVWWIDEMTAWGSPLRALAECAE